MINAYIRPSDYRELLRITSPFTAFFLPWAFVLIGQSLALCNIILPIYSSFYLIVIGNMVTSIAIAFFIQTFFPKPLAASKTKLVDLPISPRLQKVTYVFIAIYLVVQAFQVMYFKGTPLLWLLTNDPRNYFDFGVSSLNGLLNAIYLLSTTLLFLIYLKNKRGYHLALLLFLIAFPILLVSRQLFVSVFLQIACCLLLYQPKLVRKIALVFLLMLAAFIVVGNMRTGSEQLVKILEPAEYIPPYLYSLLWIYAYVVTPFNNVNAAIDFITPLGVPFFEISSLLPSILRPEIATDDGTGFALVHQSMNVSTFYLPPLLDFGKFWAFLFMAVFQLMLFLSYRRALHANSWVDVVEYAVLYMVMVLSIFTNLLLFLPVIAQLVILKIAKWRITRKNGVLALACDRFFVK